MIACPDCGRRLVTELFRGHWHTQHNDIGLTCRADFRTRGRTESESQDRFVRMCEQYGYTRALSEKIAALEEQIQAGHIRRSNKE